MINIYLKVGGQQNHFEQYFTKATPYLLNKLESKSVRHYSGKSL